MKNDFLVGGSSATGRRRSRDRAEEPQPPPAIGFRFLAVVVLLAAVFTGLGYWKVNLVFTARDHDIETRRLQELAAKRRDRETVLVSRISSLQRGEILRQAAENSLGMVSPDPHEIETITVPAEVRQRWENAARPVEAESSAEARSQTDGKEES